MVDRFSALFAVRSRRFGRCSSHFQKPISCPALIPPVRLETIDKVPTLPSSIWWFEIQPLSSSSEVKACLENKGRTATCVRWTATSSLGAERCDEEVLVKRKERDIKEWQTVSEWKSGLLQLRLAEAGQRASNRRFGTLSGSAACCSPHDTLNPSFPLFCTAAHARCNPIRWPSLPVFTARVPL